MSGQRPRLADLGCGADGASYGYHLAGFDVTGVDIAPQPRYPFRFIQADALEFSLDGFDAVHASMPCQLWSTATLGQPGAGRAYPDLITPLRPRLEAASVPWVMENVPQAPLRPDVELCGCMFGLGSGGLQLQRPRIFELSWRPAIEPMEHEHSQPAISIAGHGTPAWQRRITGHVPVARWREAMGIGWTDRAGLTEAIPPAYTQYIGAHLMAVLAS